MQKWVFILGCNNSGTSLYNHLLAYHPNISRLDAEGHRWMIGPSNIRRSTGIDCGRVWTEQLEYFIKPTLNVCKLKLDWFKNMIPGTTEYNLVKSPPDMVRSKWLQEYFKPATFLGIVRNGYATIASIMWHGRSLERAATHWNLSHKILLSDINELDRFIMIRYEELSEKPRETMHKIEEFLGLISHDYSFLDSYIPQRGWKNGERRDLNGAIPALGGIRESLIFNRNKIPKICFTSQQLRTIYEIAGEILDYFNHQPPVEIIRKDG